MFEGNSFDAHFALCKIYSFDRKTDKALRTCDEALSVDSGRHVGERAYVWYYRGLLLEKMANVEQAIESFQAAFAIVSSQEVKNWSAANFDELSEKLQKHNSLPSEGYVDFLLRENNVSGVPIVVERDLDEESPAVDFDLPDVSDVIASSSQNKYEQKDYPLEFCGDDITQLNSGDYPVDLYPIFVDDRDGNLRVVKGKFCNDAFVNKNNGMIQVASFMRRDDANQFRAFMEKEFGGAEVGAVRRITQAPSERRA